MAVSLFFKFALFNWLCLGRESMSDPIPHFVLSKVLEERLRGRRLIAGVFLTYEFDPGFFEQEILPVVLNASVSHARGIRLFQLQDTLEKCGARVAVYYDVNRLVSGDAGSAHLDVQRVPVRRRTGVFHPKNVLLLVEEESDVEDEPPARALIIGSMSANLTRSGWWENVESAHFEEIVEGEPSLLKLDLQTLLRDLRQRTADGQEHAAAEAILEFLRGMERRVRRFKEGWLLPHFYNGNEMFIEFLNRCAGDRIYRNYLEIISPYLDDAADCKPLEDLLEQFEPREVRVFLPRGRGGEAACRKDLYEAVKKLPNVSWGRLPAQLLQRGDAQRDQERFTHAKLYRFFSERPKQEICFVGSPNLTNPGHNKGGNWETGFLLEVECPSVPKFWLSLEQARPSTFKPSTESDPTTVGGTPLVLRYFWDTGVAEAYWDSGEKSPVLRLEMRGVSLGKLEALPPKQWTRLNDDLAAQLSEQLKETSFVDVFGFGKRPGLLLVQEEGMYKKPSLLFKLTVSEILRYWAMLTPDQRTAFLEAKAPELLTSGEGSELMARVKATLSEETFFDRFAGYFHAFNCLRNDVRKQLKAGREREANYRLFGRTYDSLGTLLDQLLTDSGLTEDVDRYVILLCARQLFKDLSKEFPDYWKERADEVRRLDETLAKGAEIRERLSKKDPVTMPSFLDWFDGWFLRRAAPLEAEP
jgi:hypothetical protein